MDTRIFMVIILVAVTAVAGTYRQRRKVEETERRWIVEDVGDISSSGIVKRAVGRSAGAESNSKPTTGKPSQRAADSPITYIKPITLKPPRNSKDPPPESSTTTITTTDASSGEMTNIMPETSSTQASTTPATSASTAPTAATTTTIKPPSPSTKTTPNTVTNTPESSINAMPKSSVQATTPPPSKKTPDTAKPESQAQTTTPASEKPSNDAKPEPPAQKDTDPDTSSNATPGLGSRSNFDDPSDKNSVSSDPKPAQAPKKDESPDSKNASPNPSQPESPAQPSLGSRNGDNPDDASTPGPTFQPAQEDFHIPQTDPWFGPGPNPGFGFPPYDPSANAGNFAWSSSGPSVAGASAGAFASAGAVAGASGSGFSNSGTFSNANQNPPAYAPNNNVAAPSFNTRGSFVENDQGNQGYNPQPEATNGAGFETPNYPNQGGFPDNQVYPGYYPNSNGFPGYGNYGGFPDNFQANPGFDPNFGFFPNDGFGFGPYGFGDAFPGSAMDMINEIRNKIQQQQQAINKQIQEQHKRMASSAWASASMTNTAGQFDPYAQTYTNTQTSPGNNFNYYPNHDTIGNGVYGDGVGNAVHSAVSSVSAGPHGGFQTGQISPVKPGIVSRFGESLPGTSGGSVAVFSSSSSSTKVGPDGKVHSHKSATTGVNDNGKIYYKTVHD